MRKGKVNKEDFKEPKVEFKVELKLETGLESVNNFLTRGDKHFINFKVEYIGEVISQIAVALETLGSQMYEVAKGQEGDETAVDSEGNTLSKEQKDDLFKKMTAVTEAVEQTKLIYEQATENITEVINQLKPPKKEEEDEEVGEGKDFSGKNVFEELSKRVNSKR